MDGFYVGLDIGASNVRIAISNINGEIIGEVYRQKFKKSNFPEQEIQDNIILLIEKIIAINNLRIDDLNGIGISLPALFERKSGIVTNWPNNKLWNGFELKKYLQENFKVLILLEDDANSAAIGEFTYGAAKGYENCAYITISTGIGCGLILNKKLYIGEHGWAGELGHINVLKDGPLCKCGSKGCLQSIASGPAILKKAKETALKYGFGENLISDLNEVVYYAIKGENWALDAFNEAAYFIANAVSNLVMILDLSVIVIGGGVTNAGKYLINPIKENLNSNLSRLNREVEVKIASCGDDSGVKGALALINKNFSESDLYI
ncbi:MAG: ROK family protein [Clostridiaceae bacterium]